MKELFVPYEIALKLKEKGFNEPCLGTYLTKHSIKEGKLYPAEKDCDITPEFDEDGYENFIVIKNSDCEGVPQYISAPLYQQVQDWFRKTHNMIIGVNYFDSGKSGYLDACCGCITYIKPFSVVDNIGGLHNDYYCSLNNAIEVALKTIEK